MATDIKEVAVSYWRIEKWLKNTNVERKMAVTSSLRAIKRYLDSNNIEVLDLTGNKYDPGLAVEVINRDYDGDTPDETKLIVSEMIKPVIMQDGSVIQFGQISIGYEVKDVKPNNEIINEDNEKSDKQDDINADMIKALAEQISITSKKHITNNRIFNVCISVATFIIIILLIGNLLTSYSIKTNALKDQKDETSISDTYNSVKDIDESKGNPEKSTSTPLENGNVYFIKYTIKQNDTLESICTQNGIDYTQSNINYIKSINGIENIDKIYVDTEILLPKEN